KSSLNQRFLGSSPSASTTFALVINLILSLRDRAIESIFVLGSSLGSSALIRRYSAVNGSWPAPCRTELERVVDSPSLQRRTLGWQLGIQAARCRADR